MQQNRLTRSETEKMIGGVCGGLAAYLDLDPVIVRLAFALLALASGTGVVIYLVLMIIMPTSAQSQTTAEARIRENVAGLRSSLGVSADELKGRQGRVPPGGLFLVAVGAYLLLRNLGLIGFLSGTAFWAVLLIGLGAYVLLRARQ